MYALTAPRQTLINIIAIIGAMITATSAHPRGTHVEEGVGTAATQAMAADTRPAILPPELAGALFARATAKRCFSLMIGSPAAIG
jgi:hypothetical protein